MTANHKPVIELKCSQKSFLLCQELEGQTFSPNRDIIDYIFLPTRDNYVGQGRGHQQWSNPHKRAEYNLKYLIIPFCILILITNINYGGYKKVQGTFILRALREIINMFWPGISFTCSLSGCLYNGGHGCWSRDLKENKILVTLIVSVLSRMMIYEWR